MKLYLEDTRFESGKFEGKTLKEVFAKDTAFIEECLLTDETFVIDERALQTLFEEFPDANLTEEALDNNREKIDQLETMEEDSEDINDFAEFSHIIESYDDGEDYEKEDDSDDEIFGGGSSWGRGGKADSDDDDF